MISREPSDDLEPGAGSPPPILEQAGPLLSGYDVLFCDVWGVVHDGHRAFESSCDALARFREKGGTVILVSNAPVPEERVAAMLDARRVPRETWDAIVSSGAIALAHIADRGFRRVHYIGPHERDATFFAKSTASPAALADSEAVVCTGLHDDETETATDYLPLLEKARARELPFVCANPDRVVDVGGHHYVCAGAIADLYEHMGGEVFWAGKPHASAYAAALALAERIRGETVPRERILVIGDAIRTDLAGAEHAGLDALFVASGIHRHEAMEGGALSPAKLATLFKPGTPHALAAMTQLRW
jgi:HAD superfamily hydrolase (TIGR01459 family)